MGKIKFYAVQSGRCPGVYSSWDECLKQVKGFSGAVHKSFGTQEEASAFVASSGGYQTTPRQAGSSERGGSGQAGVSAQAAIVVEDWEEGSDGAIGWTCAVCTLINAQGATCEACYTPCPPPAPTPAPTAAPAPAAAPSAAVVPRPGARWTLHFDGACRGNPGPAAGGACISSEGVVIWEGYSYIGKGTNNEAEYEGLCIGLQAAAERSAERLHVFGDSNLVVQQMRGRWEVRAPNIIKYYKRAMALACRIPEVVYEHVLRGKNSAADAIANRGIDTRGESSRWLGAGAGAGGRSRSPVCGGRSRSRSRSRSPIGRG